LALSPFFARRFLVPNLKRPMSRRSPATILSSQSNTNVLTQSQIRVPLARLRDLQAPH
jgi:hypothetical protein